MAQLRDLIVNGPSRFLGVSTYNEDVILNKGATAYAAIIPGETTTYNLGTADNSWLNVYGATLRASSAVIVTGAAEATAANTGAVQVTGGIYVAEKSLFGNDIYLGSTSYYLNGTTSKLNKLTTASDLTVGGNAVPSETNKKNLGTADLRWDNLYIVNGNVGGNLQVTGQIKGLSTLDITGATTLGSSLSVAGATTLNNTLSVIGATALNNTLSVVGAATMSNTLTVSKLLTASKGLVVSGRVYETGDDEGIIVTPASNGYAGLTLGGATGVRTVFYLKPSNVTHRAVWRYSTDGSTSYEVTHPETNGELIVHTADTAVGSSSVPVYITDSGVATAITCLEPSKGGTGNTNLVSERLVYTEAYNGAVRMTSGGNHYADSTKVAINSTAAPAGALHVEGNTSINGAITLDSKVKFMYNSTNESVDFVFI